ncbi:MAG: VanZ family protein [Lachnospiraceae bacterium]|nr:VanZ family protein [Lachnospiraceae bacterium]
MKNSVSGWQRIASQLLFIIYLFVLLYLLFFSERYGRTDNTREYSYNLVLFREIRRFYQYREQMGMKVVLINLVGNVAAFVPFGFFLPELWDGMSRLWKVLFATLGFSLLVETIQLVYKVGTFDVDDLLLNTIGGVLGYLLLCIWLRLRDGGRKGRARAVNRGRADREAGRSR